VTDTYTETTTKSWGSRITDSIKGIFFGVVLIILSCIGLFWNEGRAVQTAKSLTEGAGLVVDVDAGRVDPANEGKLVHVTGDMKAAIKPNDAEFGVSVDGLRLVRTVEMYQWKEEKKTETKKNTGGSEEEVTTYSYVRGWSDSSIDSSRFKVPDGHANPAKRYNDASFAGRDVTLGAFHPSERIVQMLPASQNVPVDAAMAEALRTRISGPVQASEGRFYLGNDPTQPRIGDMRVSYKLVPAGIVSIVGRQAGSDFADYQTHAGDTLLMVKSGSMSAADMFKAAERDNAIFTWIIRAVGAVAMFFGFLLILNPLVVVADFVPMIGNILGAGASLVSLMATAILAPIVIAIAWFWYRPIVGIIVLVAGGAVAYGLKHLAHRKSAAQKAVPAPA
jgi:transmembrane protein TMEM43